MLTFQLLYCSHLLTLYMSIHYMCYTGKVYFYNLRFCKTPEQVIDAHTSAITAMAAQTVSGYYMYVFSMSFNA